MNANVGMIYPVAATVSAYTPGSSITYGTGKVIAEARSATLTWNREDGHFFGDNAELDSANGVLGYTLDFEPTGLTDEARAYLLGETVSTGEYSINSGASPDVGFGYVRLMRTTGTSGVTDSYEAWWFKKLKFGLGSEESRTKEQNVEWRTPTLNGVGAGVSLDTSGKLVFADHKTFTTLSDAKSYLNGKAGIT